MHHDDDFWPQGELVPLTGDDAWDVEHRDGETGELVVRPPRSYRHAFGSDPIRVGLVEFRIMLFLARRPYHAFTPREIAAGVTTAADPVAEDDVPRHVDALRDQLGVFHDFVQVVPKVGYRYKA